MGPLVNHHRRYEYRADIPPVELETAYYAATKTSRRLSPQIGKVMCPGLYGVGLFDFWSRHPSKEPCPCRSVIPRSSAARCSIL